MINTLHPLENRPRLLRLQSKSMEPEFLEAKHLPDELQGVLLKSTYFTGQVSMFKISDDGSGFRARRYRI